MKSFDQFGFETKTNNTDNNAPLADDFITRRKTAADTNINNNEKSEEVKAEETKEVALSDTQSLAVEEKFPEMTVMSIKGSGKNGQQCGGVFCLHGDTSFFISPLGGYFSHHSIKTAA